MLIHVCCCTLSDVIKICVVIYVYSPVVVGKSLKAVCLPANAILLLSQQFH